MKIITFGLISMMCLFASSSWATNDEENFYELGLQAIEKADYVNALRFLFTYKAINKEKFNDAEHAVELEVVNSFIKLAESKIPEVIDKVSLDLNPIAQKRNLVSQDRNSTLQELETETPATHIDNTDTANSSQESENTQLEESNQSEKPLKLNVKWGLDFDSLYQ